MIRVGLIDGALPGDWPGLAGQEWFCRPDGAELASGHAAAMAQTVCTHAQDVLLLNAVVFPGQLSTTLDTICAAFSWLAEDPPDIVLCAFGMARSSVELSVAVARLQRAGCLMVASAPARGGQAYPAAYDGVLSVQGDARCGKAELSKLDLPQATFGACPMAAGREDIRGASAAAAHLAGLLARSVQGSERNALVGLETFVRYRGRERRGDGALAGSGAAGVSAGG
ncbi:hypothetical protein FIV06_16855 [Labrenzia sp. THAF191b]|uniref:hypothetical protein n=1 Tax=unclassified Labrenzia TaxID=2648686 RepID=UPI0012696FFA|nr:MULTISPECIES: hypothetical protein [unclassified Labrenzia]QFS99103.1 hypothetical protein FIV06_16855 [Labrenzia sp. THAF191b]QFT05417.1 hypothetical protein FIV05_16850 [Labrenzia sp. THAF191a]QFT16961.1 hypothetical protein FIV03_16865 [Labrenzia sp. THAF187b]